MGKHVHTGYLCQHAVLKKGMTLRIVLPSAFSYLYELETNMNDLCDNLGTTDEAAIQEMLEEVGTIQELLSVHVFYNIDSKVEEVSHALDLDDIGLDNDVTELNGGHRTKLLLCKLLLEKPDILLLDEPTNYLDVPHMKILNVLELI